MTPKRIKQGALALLFIVLAVVWWRNISYFQTAEDSPSEVNGEMTPDLRPSKTADAPLAGVPYSPPKVNPFLKGRLPARTNGQMPAPSVPPPQPPKLRDLAQLTGVLERGKESQAVLRLSDGRSQVVSLKDTVAGWVLVSVGKEQAVFKQNKKLDTLRLGRGL